MNCFVIMPFSREFDDVYLAIKSGAESALASRAGRCFRLDEARPAGRITERLLTELRTASICIADLTGNKPNVMWEVGFAMALNKPVIIVTQNRAELPFDIKIGHHWFTRFAWLEGKFTGFSFLRQESVDALTGAWWLDSDQTRMPNAPPDTAGVPVTLERSDDLGPPPWAVAFFNSVRKEGLSARLGRPGSM